ncbi:uncharacterized protein LOC110886778 isoform X4 [Helianthus annuus]|uniref:uncharacterized protein LOC110886778 isoform X4 n=1 Tax=Helianthus annuus TaxID=4232 RepID=UPI000B8F95E0|nr:uncharacterized protein LOC110886778 isoform X4 [Helianthus annuus]
MYLYRWSSSKDSVHIICRFHVKKLQACFPPGTDLSKGTPKIIDKASCVDVNGEVIIDEPAGKSYRGFKRSLWQHGAWGLGNRALFLVFFVKFRKYPVKFEFES